jgi:hypothetical protein
VFDAVRRSASPIVTGPGVYYDGQLSPDGRWIAYLARQGERFVALVTSTRPGGPTTQISKGEASELIWTRAGGDIFYRSGRDLIRHRVHAGDRFVAERPEVVLRGDFVGSPTSPGYVHYDVPSSGQRFLMIRQSSRFVPHLNVIRGFSDVREAATP